MTQIAPIKKSSIEDRSDVEVDIWVPTQTKNAEPLSGKYFAQSGSNVLKSKVEEIIDSAKQYLFISTSYMDNSFSTALERAGNRGVRIYVLIEDSGFSETVKELSTSVLDNALIRSFEGSLPCCVLSDVNEKTGKGYVFRSATRFDRGIDQPSVSWSLNLNKEQSVSLGRFLISRFWSNDSRLETRSSNDVKSPVSVSSSPLSPTKEFQDMWLFTNAYGDSKSVFSELSSDVNGVSTGLNSVELNELSSLIGVSEWNKTIRETVEIVPDRGEHLLSNECGLRSISLEGDLGVVFDLIADPKMIEALSSGLRLDAAQSKELEQISSLMNPISWRFQKGIKISALKPTQRYMLPSGEDATLIPKQQIDVGNNHVETLDRTLLENSEPHVSNRPEYEILAKAVEWSWSNLPPVRPSESKLAPEESEYARVKDTGLKCIKELEEIADAKKLKKAVKKLKDLPEDNEVELIRKANELRAWIEELHSIHRLILKSGKEYGANDDEALAVTRQGKKMKTSLPSIDSLPNGDLPFSGKLYTHGKFLYLEISDWEVIESAMREADELGAELSAKKNW